MNIWKKFLLGILVCCVSGGASAWAAPEIFVQGAPLRGANGLIFDRHDTLWIASNFQSVLTAMDPATGRILKSFGSGQGVVTPDDMICGPDNTLYFTSYFGGTVNRLENGRTVREIARVPGANPLTMSRDGRLYTSGFHFGEGLYEIDPAGVKPPRPILANGKDFMLNGMDFGPDGRLYAPRPYQGDIISIDVNTGDWKQVVKFDGCGLAALKFNAKGELYALIWKNLGPAPIDKPDEIVRVDTASGRYEVVAAVPPGPDNLAFDSHDRLYVAGDFDGSVTEILKDGRRRVVSPGGMIAPGGVAVLGDEVYVADFMSLRRFDRRSGKAAGLQHGYYFSALHSPLTVAPDGDNLLLSSWFENTVQVWNPRTNTPVADFKDFDKPLNAIRFQGDLIVAEGGTNRVLRVSGADPARRAPLSAGLAVPLGLAATENSLWAGDWESGTIWQLVAGGVELEKPVAVATGLSRPEGMTVGADGRLLVVETGTGRLLAINPEDGRRQVVAEGLGVGGAGPRGFPPEWMFSGVACDKAGTIYVTADVANVVYRIRP